MIVLATAADQPDITASDMLYADALRRRGFEVSGAAWNGPRAAFDGAWRVLRSTWGYYRAPSVAPGREGRGVVDAAVQSDRPGALEPAQGLCRQARDGRHPHARNAHRAVKRLISRIRRDGLAARRREAGNRRRRPFVEAAVRDTVADAVPRLAAGDVLVQEFLPEIAEGELSMVYFDGVFSHAIRKRPPEGEFRSNSRYGPTRAAGDSGGRGSGQGAAAALRVLPEMPALCPGRAWWRRCGDRDRGGRWSRRCSWSSIRRRPNAFAEATDGRLRVASLQALDEPVDDGVEVAVAQRSLVEAGIFCSGHWRADAGLRISFFSAGIWKYSVTFIGRARSRALFALAVAVEAMAGQHRHEAVEAGANAIARWDLGADRQTGQRFKGLSDCKCGGVLVFGTDLHRRGAAPDDVNGPALALSCLPVCGRAEPRAGSSMATKASTAARSAEAARRRNGNREIGAGAP